MRAIPPCCSQCNDTGQSEIRSTTISVLHRNTLSDFGGKTWYSHGMRSCVYTGPQNSLTPWSRALLGEIVFYQQVKKLSPFMEPERPLPFSQNITTGFYLEPVEFSLYHESCTHANTCKDLDFIIPI